MQKDNIISFVQRERARNVRLLKQGFSGTSVRAGKSRGSTVSKSGISKMLREREAFLAQREDVKRDKIVSLRPRNVHFPFSREVKNLDIPDGPYYL